MIFDYNNIGWTESHFSVPHTVLTDPTLPTDVQNLLLQRVKCLDGDCKIIDVRMSIDNVNRDSLHLDPALIPGVNGTGNYSGGPSAHPYASSGWGFRSQQVSWPILFKTSSPSTNPIIYVGGFPGDDTQTGPLPSQATPFTTESYLSQYAAELVNGLWGCKAITWTTLAPIALTGAPTFTAAAGGVIATLTFPVAAVFASPFCVAGGRVRLQAAKASSAQHRLRFNGTYPIVGVNPGAVPPNIVVACPKILIAPTWTAFGNLQLATPTVLPYQLPQYRPETHKKRGRPLEVPRGRR